MRTAIYVLCAFLIASAALAHNPLGGFREKFVSICAKHGVSEAVALRIYSDVLELIPAESSASPSPTAAFLASLAALKAVALLDQPSMLPEYDRRVADSEAKLEEVRLAGTDPEFVLAASSILRHYQSARVHASLSYKARERMNTAPVEMLDRWAEHGHAESAKADKEWREAWEETMALEKRK